jgi:uncharacterized protein
MKKNELYVNGPVGPLETIAVVSDPSQPWAIICHPHPLFGGTMTNKVVTTLAKAFQQRGWNTVRFNFRGVGQSGGRFDQGQGELADLVAIMDWVQQEQAGRDICLAGFSFGAYIAAQVATQRVPHQLVLVAPPVQHFAMRALPPITCPWILVQGEQDEVVSPKAVFAWAETRYPQPTIIRFPQASHFFHGCLIALQAELAIALQKETQ